MAASIETTGERLDPSAGTADRDVLIYFAHYYSPALAAEVQRLRTELPHLDVVVLGFVPDPATSELSKFGPSVTFGIADLQALPYPGKLRSVADWRAHPHRGGPGTDLALMAFYRRHPDYRRYWVVEYDVRYSGHWANLFNDLEPSGADLLCTTVFDYDEYPDFYFWSTIRQDTDPLYQTTLVRGFFPFCRVSKAAFASIDARYQRGWAGHYEVVWGTVCKLDGLKIEDVGNFGRYTPPHRRGKHYTCTPHTRTHFPGTFVFRPSFMAEDIATRALEIMPTPMLWHPVKDRP